MTLKSKFHRKDEILFVFSRRGTGVKKPVGSVFVSSFHVCVNFLSAALSQTVMYIFFIFLQ